MNDPLWTPLEPGQLTVMRLHALIAAIILTVMALVAGIVLNAATNLTPWWIGLILTLPLGWNLLVGAPRRFRAWGYRLEGQELHVRHGVWSQTETIVPMGRVQHIDIEQGVIERANSVCRLVMHTAGTAHSVVHLPGLTRERAEEIRDIIRAHIQEDIG